MPTPPKHWTEYPPQYAGLIKNVATATLPALYGPYDRGEALTFRQSFNRFREALRVSLLSSNDRSNSSYPARLYEMVETLSVKVKQSTDDHTQYNVIFDTHPIVKEMNRLDPAGAQTRQLSRAQFAVAQRPPPLSTPIFSDEEMQDRLDAIERKDGTEL